MSGLMRAFRIAEATQATKLGGMGVEVKGAGNQQVEARIYRLARGRDNVLPADGAVFGADRDRRAALGAILALEKGAVCSDEVAGPRRQALEGNTVTLSCCLTPSDLR